MPSHLDFWARAPERRCPPFLCLPTTSRLLAWLLASTLATPALAQPTHAMDEAPAPLRHPTLPRQSPQPPAELDWTAANRAVAEFPRGHADIVNWEASSAAATATTSPKRMHDKGPHPMPSGHHTDHHPTPQGGRP